MYSVKDVNIRDQLIIKKKNSLGLLISNNYSLKISDTNDPDFKKIKDCER